jgi:hypothetical protein
MRSERARWYAVGIAGLALVGLGLISTPRIAGAVVDGDVRAGVYPDVDAVSVGGGVLAPVGHSGRWYFNPNLEVAMGGSRDIVAMSGDFHYDFAEQGNTSFWMGGGPAILVTDRASGNNDTDLGINVLTGVGARRGDVRPFAQLRGTMANDSQVALSAGIRF